MDAIAQVLDERGAVVESRHITAGASGARTVYRIDGGTRRIMVKEIRPVRLPATCSTCPLNNGRDCQEGFYGVRLYKATDGRYLVGVCLQRMDLCQEVDTFLRSPLLPEVIDFRERQQREFATNGKGARAA